MSLLARIRRLPRYVVYPILLIAYFLWMTIGGYADHLLLHATTQPIGALGFTPHLFAFDGGQLQIWTQRAANNKKPSPDIYVLGFCGNAERAEECLDLESWRWQQAEADIWFVNYPGFGASTGPASVRTIPAAALLAYDQLARVAAGKPIFVSANSIGTTAALYVAAQRKVAGLVLQNPPPLRSLIMQRYGWWNLFLLATPVALHVPQELNSLRNGPLVSAPAVFVLSDEDQIIPPRYHQMVVDAYAGAKRTVVLHHAGHNSAASDREEEEIHAGVGWLLSGK
jgi:pimeloyl-ACP methyl ester carboxylesterase